MSRMSLKTGVSAKAIRFAISGAVAMGLLAGCAGSASKHLARAGEQAVRATGKQSRAVDNAEQAVAKTPNDAAARFALGQTYLDAGRFQSAATSFSDAIALGDGSGRTQLSLALAQIGAGNAPAAVGVLDEARDSIGATDRGLALALAGETGRGVAVLMDALRSGENNPKLRQNLAFAYALDGQWREARVTMAQDVPADQIDDRIGEWAMMAQPEAGQRRVASLLGAPAGVADAGQPVALALNPAAQAERFAAAETPKTFAPAAQELPPVDAAPAPIAPAFAAAPSTAFAAPAPAAPVVAPASFAAAFPAAKPAARTTAKPARVARVAPVATVQPAVTGTGSHMVQIGAFSSEANAKRAVRHYTARNAELRNLRITITPAVVNGKNFWRVAAADLDRGAATRLCSGLKNRGGACFAYAATSATARPAFALAGGAAKARHR